LLPYQLALSLLLASVSTSHRTFECIVAGHNMFHFSISHYAIAGINLITENTILFYNTSLLPLTNKAKIISRSGIKQSV